VTSSSRAQRGISLLALLLLLACKADETVQKKVALRAELHVIRQALRNFHMDQRRFPHSLEELREKHYLRVIPPDPFTGKADWRLTTEETVRANDFSTSTAPNEVVITDVHSSAPGYSEY
jgi:general secretion pathway protein G